MKKHSFSHRGHASPRAISRLSREGTRYYLGVRELRCAECERPVPYPDFLIFRRHMRGYCRTCFLAQHWRFCGGVQ